MIKAIQFFQSIRSEREEINNLADQVDELRASLLPSAIRYDKINVQTSPEADLQLDTLEEIYDLERKIRKKLAALIPKYNKAQDAICQLPSIQERKVLYLFYLDPRILSMAAIAMIMNCTERYIYDLRQKAAQHIHISP